MKALIGMTLTLLVLSTSGFAAEFRTLHIMENDEIKVEINDYEYPFDQIWYLNGPLDWIENLYHMKIAFWDGSTIWEYNTTTIPTGHTRLIEVQDWSFSGSDPFRTAHVVLGDHATTPSFTIDLTISMAGNGVKAIRSDFIISSTPGTPVLSGAKLYLYGDPRVAGTPLADQSAFYAARGLFYVYDTASAPDLYFGWNTSTPDKSRVPMHYYGHHWSGAYGTQPMRDYMVLGQNLPDLVEPAAGDQLAAWNWDLGTVATSLKLTLFMGVGTSVDDLAAEVTPIFIDDFETGDTSRWSSSVP